MSIFEASLWGVLIVAIWVVICILFLVGVAAILQIFTTRFSTHETILVTVDLIEYQAHKVTAIVQYSNRIILIDYKNEKILDAKGYKAISWIKL